jgi:hypothetical protein
MSTGAKRRQHDGSAKRPSSFTVGDHQVTPCDVTTERANDLIVEAENPCGFA